MNVVDSSGWIEYFTEAPNAAFFASSIEHVNNLIVPSICIYEVFKWVTREREEMQALKAVAQMQLGKIVELNSRLAVSSARLGLHLKLALADSIVLATARAHEAMLWTQDEDFKEVEGVKYIAKKKTDK